MTESGHDGGVGDSEAAAEANPERPESPDVPPSEYQPATIRTARRRLTAAGVTFAVSVVLLWVASPLGLFHASLLMALLLMVPALAVVQVPLAEEDGPAALPRVPTYVGSGIMILFLGTVSTASGLSGFGVTAMGLSPVPAGFALVTGVGLAVAILLLVCFFRWVATRLGWNDAPLLALLLPRSSKERAYFAGLSLVAGTGEELAYRSYAMAALQVALVGPWGAAAISSVAFGVLHSYQGRLGVVRTGVIGFALAASLVLTGSIWPAMIAHVLVDLVAGLVLGERLLSDGSA